MKLVTVLVFCLGIATAYGLKCADISGKWQNELGSRMVLRLDDSNRLSGEYSTAVESNPGAAAFVTNITGLFSKQSDGSTLAFSVLFNHGSSLASWVGQCIVCGDKEILHMTFTLRRHTTDPLEKWSAVVVNQNTFQRFEDEAEYLRNSPSEKLPAVRTLSVVSEKPPGGVELRGKWQADSREEIEIFRVIEGVLEGKHQSTDLIGRKDGNDIFTAVTLMSVSGKRVRSWTGHIYDGISSSPKILETSWLEHEFNPSCANARDMVRFGVQIFSQTAPGFESMMAEPETFMDKVRKFFSGIF